MTLTDLTIKTAKPIGRTQKLFDGGGLYLEITPTGSKLWRMKYRYASKEKKLAFGRYPYITLKDAREEREKARTLLAQGIDPGERRKADKAERLARTASTFEAVARDWFGRMMADRAASHKDKVIARLQNDIFPWLGRRPIAEITTPEVLACLRRIEDRGARDTAHRAMQNCTAVFRYAVTIGVANANPCVHLKGALPPAKSGHFAAITDPGQVGPLLRRMDAVGATFMVKCALKLAPYVFCRPGELRTMRWDEVHLDAAEWRYLASKGGEPHLVPLARQAVAILRELQPLTGRWPYVFPGRDSKMKPMSGNTINHALRRAGINTRAEQTGHGFRAMARTILHERLHIDRDVIEHQLAHRVPDPLGTAYNRTKFLDERRQMMQRWADYLDRLRDGREDEAPVVPQPLGPREGR